MTLSHVSWCMIHSHIRNFLEITWFSYVCSLSCDNTARHSLTSTLICTHACAHTWICWLLDEKHTTMYPRHYFSCVHGAIFLGKKFSLVGIKSWYIHTSHTCWMYAKHIMQHWRCIFVEIYCRITRSRFTHAISFKMSWRHSLRHQQYSCHDHAPVHTHAHREPHPAEA